MKIGLVGYQGSGKSTLFEWITDVKADPALAHTTQSAMAAVPEDRVEQLCKIYNPKKITLASLELVDTPGLARGSHEGNPARLATIREAGALLVVVAAWGGVDAAKTLTSFEEDLLLADLEIVTGRIDRLRDQLKKPKPGKEKDEEELKALEPIAATLGEGRSVREMELSPDQLKATKSFQLLTLKPRLVVFNTADDETDRARFAAMMPAGSRSVALPLGLELELQRMGPEERELFCAEMGVKPIGRIDLIRTIMDASGQMLFFTAGEKEVRTWMISQGATAVEAAGAIHTDMARGFIRAETMQVADLVRLGSEREIKAANLLRQEPKDYVIRDGDIITFKFSV